MAFFNILIYTLQQLYRAVYINDATLNSVQEQIRNPILGLLSPKVKVGQFVTQFAKKSELAQIEKLPGWYKVSQINWGLSTHCFHNQLFHAVARVIEKTYGTLT